jgi:hypothetical protein
MDQIGRHVGAYCFHSFVRSVFGLCSFRLPARAKDG